MGGVYFLKDNTGRVKIGSGGNVERRIKQVQKSYRSADLDCVRIISHPEEWDLEAWLHARYRSLHLPHAHRERTNEWYAFHEEMMIVAPPTSEEFLALRINYKCPRMRDAAQRHFVEFPVLLS